MTGLTLGAGSNLQFDLNKPVASGGVAGTDFDQIIVTGAVAFNGATTVTPSSLVAGDYVVIDATGGSISGTAAPTVTSTGDTRLTYATGTGSWNPVSNPSGTQIVVNISGSVASTLNWTGATNGTWDLHQTANWHTTEAIANPNLFFNGDKIFFDDTGANRDISLGGSVAPGDMNFSNNSTDYSISGGGSIGGTGTLTKSGNGALTLATSNTFSGATTLSGGTLNINNNRALGSSPSLTISGGAALGNTSGTAVTVSSNPTQTWTTDITFNGPSDLNLGTVRSVQRPRAAPALLTSQPAR